MTDRPEQPTATATGSPAFDDFFRSESDGQVRRAFLLLGSRESAEDVVAEAFLQVLRRWATLEDPGPYLNRCVLNGCRDHARRAGRPRRPLPIERMTADTTATVEVAEALAGLPFRQRAAIVLRFYGGYSENEIAAVLGCRPGTVGSAIHRGLATLREELS